MLHDAQQCFHESYCGYGDDPNSGQPVRGTCQTLVVAA